MAVKKIIIMGIDPGLDGAICFMAEDGSVLNLSVMPTLKVEMATKKRVTLKRKSGNVTKLVPSFRREVDIKSVADLMGRYQPDMAYIEKVNAMPGQGVTSMFSFGFGYGMLVGVCKALQGALVTVLVSPKTWQKGLHQGVPGESAKDRSLAAAETLFPGQCHGHDGKIDAILITEYARRSLKLN